MAHLQPPGKGQARILVQPLVDQFERKLDLARRLCRVIRAPACLIEIEIQAVGAEARMVQHVEELRAELQARLLFEMEIFEKRGVDAHLRGAVENVPPGVAVGAERRCRKCRRVEPQARTPVRRTEGYTGHAVGTTSESPAVFDSPMEAVTVSGMPVWAAWIPWSSHPPISA